MRAASAKYEETLEFSTQLPSLRSTGDVELRPKKIVQWLSELPRANPDVSAAKIVEALNAVNQVDLSVTDRIQLLEVYRLAVASIVEELQSKFETQSIPISARAKASVDLAQSLITGLASGYMIAARATVETESVAKIDSSLAVTAIQRSIYFLGQVLLNANLTYRSAAPGVWADLYELYRYAEGQALLMESVEIEGVGVVDNLTTIDATFQHILLLAAGDPAGMQKGECKRLYELLKRVQEEIHIERGPQKIDRVGYFVFDLSKDKPPAPLAATPDIQATADVRTVNCIAAISRLHNSLKTKNNIHFANTSQLVDVSNLELLRRAARKWTGHPGRRQSVRSPQMIDLPVCSGISGTHYYASGQRSFAEFERNVTDSVSVHHEETRINSGNEVFVDLAEEPDSNGWIPARGDEKSAPADFDAENTIPPGDRLHHMQVARMMDESAGGVRLRLFTGSMVRLLVGEIVSMQYGGGDSWRVGMVRWLNASARDYVDVGVMFLSPDVEPVAVRRSDAKPGLDPLIPALLLPGNESLGSSETLIVPRGMHTAGETLTMIDGQGIEREINTMSLKERTSSFDQIVTNS